MNFKESGSPDSGPQQNIESICQEWESLFTEYTPIAFGVNNKKEVVLILDPIPSGVRNHFYEEKPVYVIIGDTFSIGSEIFTAYTQDNYREFLEFYCHGDDSYDSLSNLITYLSCSHTREFDLEIYLRGDSCVVNLM